MTARASDRSRTGAAAGRRTAAAAALGLRVPAKIRTAADIPALNRPWCVAVAAGLLELSEGTVTGGPGLLAHWPAVSVEEVARGLAERASRGVRGGVGSK